jgi:hypothetical protein
LLHCAAKVRQALINLFRGLVVATTKERFEQHLLTFAAMPSVRRATILVTHAKGILKLHRSVGPQLSV